MRRECFFDSGRSTQFNTRNDSPVKLRTPIEWKFLSTCGGSDENEHFSKVTWDISSVFTILLSHDNALARMAGAMSFLDSHEQRSVNRVIFRWSIVEMGSIFHSVMNVSGGCTALS